MIEFLDKKTHQFSFSNEISNGLKNYIILKNELDYTINKGNIILLDEPDIFMHQVAQKDISEKLLSLNNINDFSNKYLLTTHSEHIINQEFDFIFKKNDSWIQEDIEDIEDFENIQINVLTNKKILDNPINVFFLENKEISLAIKALRLNDFDSFTTKIYKLIENKLKKFMGDDYKKESKFKNLKYIVNNWKDLELNLTIEQDDSEEEKKRKNKEVNERFKSEILTSIVLFDIRNLFQHDNKKSENELKILINLYLNSFLSIINILDFLITNKEEVS